MGGGARRLSGRSGTPGKPRLLSIVPGTTQFTVMPCGARSSASALVRPASPAFAAITCARPVAPRWPVSPPMLTIAPPPDLARCGTHAWLQRNAASRMLPTTPRHSSSVMRSNGVSMRAAALLISASSRPKRFSVASTSVRTCAGSVRSAMCSAALPPACAISATVSSACARELRGLTITAAPPAASERAMARPMLRAPPVTRATLPASSTPRVMPTVLGNSFLRSMTDPRQPGGERRKNHDHADQQEDAGDEGHAGKIDVLHAGTGRRDAFHDEKQQPERRRRIAHFQRKQHDEAEPGEIEAERLREREEDRRGEQHLRQRVHEAAEEDDHADHDEHHADRRNLEADGPVHQAGRSAR